LSDGALIQQVSIPGKSSKFDTFERFRGYKKISKACRVSPSEGGNFINFFRRSRLVFLRDKPEEKKIVNTLASVLLPFPRPGRYSVARLIFRKDEDLSI